MSAWRELTSAQFWADTGVRAIRTMAQAAIGIIGAGAAMSDVDWLRVLSGSALAGLVSVLMSLDRIGSGGAQAQSVEPAQSDKPAQSGEKEASENAGK